MVAVNRFSAQDWRRPSARTRRSRRRSCASPTRRSSACRGVSPACAMPSCCSVSGRCVRSRRCLRRLPDVTESRPSRRESSTTSGGCRWPSSGHRSSPRSSAFAPGVTFHDLQWARYGFCDADIGAEMARPVEVPRSALRHRCTPRVAVERIPRHDRARDDRGACTALRPSQHLSDGIDTQFGLDLDAEWQDASIAKALARRGSLEGIMEWS